MSDNNYADEENPLEAATDAFIKYELEKRGFKCNQCDTRITGGKDTWGLCETCASKIEWTEKGQPTFLTLHEVKHALRLIEGVITEQVGEQCLDYDPECLTCKAWNALQVLIRYVYGQEFNKAADMIVNTELATKEEEK